MKKLVPLVLAAAISTQCFAADVNFYLGTYTKSGKSQGIYLGTLDTDTGKLGPVKLVAEIKNPSFLALSPNGKNLYSAIEADGAEVAAFKVKADGTLDALNNASSGGGSSCHVWVDSTNRTLLSASYGGGSASTFKLKEDGAIGEVGTLVKFSGTGPNTRRQEKPHAHAIYTDAANKFVYVPDLGTDNVWTFKFDADKSTITATEPPSGKVPPGGGPRHMAIHPNGKFAYVNNEMTLTVTAFERNVETGALNPIQTLSTLPEGTSVEKLSTAEIFCHPTGKWLYVSNRTHDTIAVYAIEASGQLKLVEIAPAGVKVPRGFNIDPTGKWLVAGGQNDDRIAVHKIDPATGKLTLTSETAEVGSPVCVIFASGK